MAATNHCQFFPSNTEAVGIHPYLKSSYCVLPPHQRELPIALSNRDWFNNSCNSCEHYKLWSDRPYDVDQDDFLEGNPDACTGFLEFYYRGKGNCKKGIVPQKSANVVVEVQRSLWSIHRQSYVFHVDNQRNIVSPLASPNVYDVGKICWGGNKDPKKLNVMVNRFFGSPFNSDLYSCGGETKAERLQNTFNSVRNRVQGWAEKRHYEDMKSYKAFNTTLPYDAAIVVANPKTLDLLPAHCIKTFNSEPRAIGWAVFSREQNCYFIRFKDLSDSPHSGSECIAKKKRMSGSSKVMILGNAYEYGHLINDILDAKDRGVNQEVPEEEEESDQQLALEY